MSSPPWLAPILLVPALYALFFLLLHVKPLMHLPPRLFTLIMVPALTALIFLLVRFPGWADQPVVLYLQAGVMLAALVHLVKRAGRARGFSPMNGTVESAYAQIHGRLTSLGFDVETYQILDGWRLTVRLKTPSLVRFLATGLVLTVAGILPGIVYFCHGRDRFVITLTPGSNMVVFGVDHSSGRAAEVWGRINLKMSMEMLEDEALPDGLTTTVRKV